MESIQVILSPHPQLLLRIISHLSNNAERENGHYLPFVEQMKAYRSRFESFNRDVLKYKKTAALLTEMDKELQRMDKDDVVQQQLDAIVQLNKTLQQSLQQLEPMMKTQSEQIKNLTDYLVPPTEEVFRARVLEMLAKASVEKVPKPSMKTCAICLEAPANIMIKRACGRSTSTTTPSASSGRKSVACESATCACGPTMCQECMIRHYWVSSTNTTKSYSRCACCRAEFCLKDIHLIQFEEVAEDNTKVKVTTKDNNKRKDREEEEDDNQSPLKKTRSEHSTTRSTSTSSSTSTSTSTTTTTTHHSSRQRNEHHKVGDNQSNQQHQPNHQEPNEHDEGNWSPFRRLINFLR
ncbi:hypothetical protein SAMD00019534_060750 [Acytostelium subglobosum LB1]|uniref:hypothetical protein n=1 Tax=Acytostelium subglobosum LB1 TaxID=1410327 RepID=UPI000644D800|nr:hypothetical protein SAMD00019534_060750 [Acytostelium subglobosum LB1]GAM22900.1 hypothetical protein SAMD00019534_060750 [Acytostelium subglobosum LB1]|eukprot:XP_012754127.1 hypothetical protein SAMD00019534_060750 [Acytostelium subglobosum LB1]